VKCREILRKDGAVGKACNGEYHDTGGETLMGTPDLEKGAA
jgi:hypothetical protein